MEASVNCNALPKKKIYSKLKASFKSRFYDTRVKVLVVLWIFFPIVKFQLQVQPARVKGKQAYNNFQEKKIQNLLSTTNFSRAQPQ